MPGHAPEFELAEGEIHVWVLPLEHPDKTRRRELAHLGERQLLARYLGASEASVQFERGEFGKPRLPGDPLHFNLSHSGGWALLAVTRDLEVGIDLQGPHPTVSRPWFAERVCTPRERAALGPVPDPAELLRLWVRKEAVIKARGDLSYVSVGEVDLLEDIVDGGWHCRELEFPWDEHYRAAVAFPDARAALVVRGRWSVGDRS